jgi:hypothetical protein
VQVKSRKERSGCLFGYLTLSETHFLSSEKSPIMQGPWRWGPMTVKIEPTTRRDIPPMWVNICICTPLIVYQWNTSEGSDLTTIFIAVNSAASTFVNNNQNAIFPNLRTPEAHLTLCKCTLPSLFSPRTSYKLC